MIPPALRIASAQGVPGTASALVRDAHGVRLLLANHHVVFGGGAVSGDRVWALPPDWDDGSDGDAVCLGRARCGQIGRVTFVGETYFVDCAVVELANDTCFPSWLELLMANAWPSEIATPEPGMRVFKHGATSGTTEGVLVDVSYPDHPFVEGRSWTAPGQLLVDSRDPGLNFSAPGDSGAALLDEHGRILGLLWGSNASGQGVACPIAPVLDYLAVTLFAAAQQIRRFA